jgi:hypothetical protein
MRQRLLIKNIIKALLIVAFIQGCCYQVIKIGNANDVQDDHIINT